MPTAMLTPSSPATQHSNPPHRPAEAPLPAGLLKTPPARAWESEDRMHPELAPRAALPETGLQTEPVHGIFMGLRVAFAFNAVLVLTGLLGYEAWSLLAR